MSYDHAILSSVNKDLATELHHKTEELQGEKITLKGEILSEKLQSERRRCKSRYKQIKRREVALEQQKSKVLKLSEEISTQEKTVEVQEKHYKQALAAKKRYRPKANYDVKKNQNQKLKLDHLSEEFDEMQRSLYRRIRDLEKTVKDKENECDLLQLENEELMHAMPERSISTFHSGKFDDSVRQCCFRLLSLNACWSP